MKKTYIIILFIFILFGFVFFQTKKDKNYTILQKTIEGNSMYPLLKNGEKINVLVNFYKDNYPEKGDIVAFNYGGSNHLYIKVVKATSEDDLTLINDNLYVNGEPMKNSVGAIYTFSYGEQKMLGLYIKNGKIPEDSYLIFGDNISDSVDSRKFGAISKDDMYGKFVLLN